MRMLDVKEMRILIMQFIIKNYLFDRDCLEKGVHRETRECGARG